MKDGELESLLRNIRLEAPSDELNRRLDSVWSSRCVSYLPWKWLAFGSLCGAAAAVGFLFTHSTPRVGPGPRALVSRSPESPDNLVRLALDRTAGRSPLPALSVSVSTRELP